MLCYNNVIAVFHVTCYQCIYKYTCIVFIFFVLNTYFDEFITVRSRFVTALNELVPFQYVPVTYMLLIRYIHVACLFQYIVYIISKQYDYREASRTSYLLLFSSFSTAFILGIENIMLCYMPSVNVGTDGDPYTTNSM